MGDNPALVSRPSYVAGPIGKVYPPYLTLHVSATMTIRTIDTAILAHRTWVERFQTSLKGTNIEVFDVKKAHDDTACALGKWLRTDNALALLGKDSLAQITGLHATFHEIAGIIAARLNEHESHNDIQEWVEAFENLSHQLVILLMLAKKKV